MCVQNLDDSRGFAIRITYRISLRSSSLWEPRHPLLKVVLVLPFGMSQARRKAFLVRREPVPNHAFRFKLTRRGSGFETRTGSAVHSSEPVKSYWWVG
jgi:hypothetical protein